MASGEYRRTGTRCQRTWSVPADIAEERPSLEAATNQVMSLIGSKFADQAALRAHYLQLGAAAKCPQCGATSFTQEKVAESAGAPEPPSDGPASAPAASALPAGQARIYVLNQKPISLTGEAWIEDSESNHAFAVDGRFLSLRGTHVLNDLSGQPLYEISRSLAPHLHKTMNITKGGQTAATVQEAIFNLGGNKVRITLAGGQELAVRGDWLNREFQVNDQAGQQVMTASRVWFTIHDAYGIQIASDFEVPWAWRSPSCSRASKPNSRVSSRRSRTCSVASARCERRDGSGLKGEPEPRR